MHHSLKVHKLNSLRTSEAVATVCDAAEKLKLAARAYADAKTGEFHTPKLGEDFNDKSPEGKALLNAAREYALWHDALEYVRRK